LKVTHYPTAVFLVAPPVIDDNIGPRGIPRESS